jgi:membrane associated rhomboid family serine protease
MNRLRDLKYRLLLSDVSKLIFMSICIYLFILVLRVFFQLNGTRPEEFTNLFIPYFAMHTSALATLKHAWVLLTHFLSEWNLMDLFTNCLWLYFFGFDLEDLKGKGACIYLYFFAGIASGIIILLITAFSPNAMPLYFFTMKMPIIAMAIASIVIAPGRKIFHLVLPKPIHAYWIAAIFLLLSIYNLYATYGAIILIPIASAIIIGFWYAKGLDSILFSLQKMLNNLLVDKEPKSKIIKAKYNSTEPNSGYTYIQPSQKKIDELLDKINDFGMDSLSPQEKEWLKNASK